MHRTSRSIKLTSKPSSRPRTLPENGGSTRRSRGSTSARSSCRARSPLRPPLSPGIPSLAVSSSAHLCINSVHLRGIHSAPRVPSSDHPTVPCDTHPCYRPQPAVRPCLCRHGVQRIRSHLVRIRVRTSDPHPPENPRIPRRHSEDTNRGRPSYCGEEPSLALNHAPKFIKCRFRTTPRIVEGDGIPVRGTAATHGCLQFAR